MQKAIKKNIPDTTVKKEIIDDTFSLSKLNYELDLSKAKYEIDILQNKILDFYLRTDPKFRQAFYTDYTFEFLSYIRDKAKLKEPFHLNVIGVVRSSKSFSSIFLSVFHQACYKKKFNVDYIRGNVFEMVEAMKVLPEDQIKNSIWQIDEEKQTVFSVGSTARKMKIEDIQNIIAINNISTIMLNPTGWANKDAYYGLRAFGRDFGLDENGKLVRTRSNRFMLYNLQSGKSETPMGCVYIPYFPDILPKDYAEELEKEYLKKKMAWVEREMRGESDVLSEIKKNVAKQFLNDKVFLTLKKKNDKKTYISTKLGSEYTVGEINEILSLTGLLQNGITFD